MNILIVSRNQFELDAVSTWLKQKHGHYLIRGVDTLCEANSLIAKGEPHTIIVSYDAYCEHRNLDIDAFLSLISREQFQFIVTVGSIDKCNLVRLIARKISAIIHLRDAQQFFCSWPGGTQFSGTFLSPALQGAVCHVPPPEHGFHQLSQAELRVASMVIQGYDTKSIADRLSRSQFTVNDHRKHIKNKLDVTGGKKALLDSIYPYSTWLLNAARR